MHENAAQSRREGGRGGGKQSAAARTVACPPPSSGGLAGGRPTLNPLKVSLWFIRRTHRQWGLLLGGRRCCPGRRGAAVR